MLRTRSTFRRLCLLALLPFVGACAGKGSITGRVTFKGVPLPSGAICFHSEEGNRDVYNARIENGEFKIEDVRSGMTKVTVVTVDPTAGPKSDLNPSKRPSGTSGFVELPLRYRDPEQSGLTFKVEKGVNQYAVDLTP